MEVQIKRIEPNDVSILSTVAKQVFYDTFVGTCTEDDMNVFLETNYNEQTLLSEINNPSNHYFFSVYNNEVTGYLLFAEDYSYFPEIKKYKALELKRIYVLKEHQGKGSAQALINFYLQFAQENNYQVVFLGVWENNIKAQKFYGKFGFANSTFTHDFPIGNTPQTDIWMWKFL